MARASSERVALKEPPARDGLAVLADLAADDLKATDQIIVERLHSPVPLIPQLGSYIVAAGGKRIRPLLTLACARLCGYAGDRHPRLAAAVEFIHTATLLHDDVVDESDQRRGRASANAVFGNKASVLVGDFLFARAFELMVEDGSLDVLGILSRASAVIAEGEVMQLATSNDLATGEAEYLQVIGAKTAALFAAACEVGAVVAGRPRAEWTALAEYGTGLGIAFQIVDDVLDYEAAELKLGKAIGDDLREGKVTLPVILAYARGSEAERAFWRRIIEEMTQDPGDLAEATALMRKHRAFPDSLARARAYAQAAQAALAPFPASPWKAVLSDVAAFAVEREF